MQHVKLIFGSVFCSNVPRNIDVLSEVLHVFFLYLQINVGVVWQLGYDLFLLNPLKLIYNFANGGYSTVFGTLRSHITGFILSTDLGYQKINCD
jgi:hypothetical protein